MSHKSDNTEQVSGCGFSWHSSWKPIGWEAGQEINIWPEWPESDDDPDWFVIAINSFDELKAAGEKVKAFLTGPDE